MGKNSVISSESKQSPVDFWRHALRVNDKNLSLSQFQQGSSMKPLEHKSLGLGTLDVAEVIDVDASDVIQATEPRLIVREDSEKFVNNEITTNKTSTFLPNNTMKVPSDTDCVASSSFLPLDVNPTTYDPGPMPQP